MPNLAKEEGRKAMLDRKTIKKDVKGILGGESRGSVLLATLIVFIITLVYFGAVWAIAQFYPVTQADFKAISDWAAGQLAAQQGAAMTTAAYNTMLLAAAEAFGSIFSNISMINLWAMLLELIMMLPLAIGVKKFMLRVIRLKNPGAGTVFKGYSGSCFFRAILLPFWQTLCLLGWKLIMLVLLCGVMAGTALATGLSTQDFAVLSGGVTGEAITGIFTAEYLARYGWIYTAAAGVWYVLTVWLMVFKSISYSFSGMALAERPQIGIRKAVRASRRITRRNHFALMVVSLSYIGWYLLAGLALALVVAVGIGLNMLNMGQLGLIITLALLFVVELIVLYLLMPYRVGVHAQCYVRLKRAALEDGVVMREDFRGKRELRAAEESAQ